MFLRIFLCALLLGTSGYASPKKVRHVVRTAKADAPLETSTSQSKLVAIAMRDLGVTEGSSRAMEMLRRCGFRNPRTPWCGASVSDWLIASGAPIHRTAAVSDLRKQLEQKAKRVSVSPGAVVVFRWSHIGVVVRVAGNYFYSIEGNSSNRVRIVKHRLSQAAATYRI